MTITLEPKDFNQENLRAWITALRSDKYKQSTEALRTTRGYCCLGVLSDISGLIEFELGKDEDDDIYYPKVKNKDKPPYAETGNPPDEVVQWLLKKDYSEEQSVTLIEKLVDMNDNEGMNFYQIADFLEQFLEVEDSNA